MVLALPLAGLLFLRMVRERADPQTESELIAQAAVLAAADKAERLHMRRAVSMPGRERARAVRGGVTGRGRDLAADPVLAAARSRRGRPGLRFGAEAGGGADPRA